MVRASGIGCSWYFALIESTVDCAFTVAVIKKAETKRKKKFFIRSYLNDWERFLPFLRNTVPKIKNPEKNPRRFPLC